MKGRHASVLLVGIALPRIIAAQTCVAEGNLGTCSIQGQAVLNASGVVGLQISSATTTLPAPTAVDFKAGFNNSAGPTLTIASNQPWMLLIRATTPMWTATNASAGLAARATKPVGDLKWSTASNGAFTPLSTSDLSVASGVATAGHSATLYFQTVYNWAVDTPGSYSLSLVLTLSAP